MSIRCEAIFKSYKNLAVLENINLEVKAGEFVCLLGPSGCGKSSFLRILAGIDEASSGRFFLPESSAPQQAKTGRVFQEGKPITYMTKEEAYHNEKIEDLMREKIPRRELPSGVVIEKTPFEEEQMMRREIDNQRRKEDPEFKGAFHEKKGLPKRR